MEQPNIISTIVDPVKKITYNVVAYRKLTREELVLSVRQYSSQKKRRKKLPPNSTVTIVTVIGCTD